MAKPLSAALLLGCVACDLGPSIIELREAAPDAGAPVGELLPAVSVVVRRDAGVVADTYLYATSPNTNPGTLNGFFTGDAAGEKRALVRFELSMIPAGSVVSSARFGLIQVWQSGQQVRVHRATQPWLEMSVTWNSYGGGTHFDPAVAASFDSVRFDPTVDVTALVQAWVDGTPNHGFLLEETFTAGSDVHSEFFSSEAFDPAERPRLEVTFQPRAAVGAGPGDGGPARGNLDVGCACSTFAAGVLGALPAFALLFWRRRRRTWKVRAAPDHFGTRATGRNIALGVGRSPSSPRSASIASKPYRS